MELAVWPAITVPLMYQGIGYSYFSQWHPEKKKGKRAKPKRNKKEVQRLQNKKVWLKRCSNK
jgi:hypothetical protein